MGDRDGNLNRPGTTSGKAFRGRSDALVSVANRLRSPMYVSDRALLPEDVTVNTIEALLRIPSLASGRTEEQLVASFLGEDGLVTDPDFLPGISSLFPDPNQPPAAAPPDVTWRRVSGTLYFPTGKTPRLLQGLLDSGSFLGALAAVAACRGGELLLDLIVSDEAAAHGAYTFQFFKHGCWQQVVVDNYLPCVSGQERLAFACSAVVGELWPSLLEKAYAKIHGSYYALSGGSVTEALVDLTGGVGLKVRTDAPPYWHHPAAAAAAASGGQHQGGGGGGGAAAAAREAQVWSDLQSWLAARSIVACVAKRKRPARNRFRPDAVSPDPDGPSPVPTPAPPDYPVDPASPAAAAGEEISGEEGPHGLLYGQVYSVLECRAVTDALRLVRLHCPWSQGLWMGPWAQGSPEWQHPSVAPCLDSFRASWEDEATFWMPLRDFAAFFNRLHVCRMFPPTWHQLTLHCGWQGPSAGGPYHTLPPETQAHYGAAAAVALPPGAGPTDAAAAAPAAAAAGGRPGSPSRMGGPGVGAGSGGSYGFGTIGALGPSFGSSTASLSPQAGTGAAASASSMSAGGGGGGGGSMSSTWCCNPQFRLTVRKGCEVLVCLAQQDPTVAARAHVAKRLRKKAVGMQILRVPLDSLGRRWEVRPGELVASLPACAGREVVAAFRAAPDFAYVVVPHAGRAGEEGAFILRSLSSSPLEVEQLPAPLCLVVGGQWSGYLAGGGRHCPSWGSNPQYMISCGHRAQVVASLTRLDLKYAIMKAPRDPALDLDLVLAHPDQGPDGPGRRTAVRDGDIVAAASSVYGSGGNGVYGSGGGGGVYGNSSSSQQQLGPGGMLLQQQLGQLQLGGQG
ncbi:hypothetical protein Agub_g5892, partial [Astrephomene gubernaculifera]